MLKRLLPLFIIFLFNNNSRAQLIDSVKAHIDSSLLILEKNSLYANRIDWPSIKTEVYSAAEMMNTKEAAIDAMKIVFDALGDKHAAFYEFNDSYKLPNPELESRITDSLRAEWARGPRVKKQMLGKIAYISLPFMGVQKQSAIDEHASWIYDAVAELSKNNPQGWIIDLRVNGGGNIRPMLAGLAPFFEDGIIGYYISRDGLAEEPSSFKDGNFYIDGIQQATIKSRIAAMPNAKIAVLIGAGTASSGEGVALALRQRSNTRLFGSRSAGLANSTNGFVFNNQNCYYLISTAYIGDKNKRPLPESIEPDVPVAGPESFSNPSQDAVVKEAMEWIGGK